MRLNEKLTVIWVVDNTGPNLKETCTFNEQLGTTTSCMTFTLSGTGSRNTDMCL